MDSFRINLENERIYCHLKSCSRRILIWKNIHDILFNGEKSRIFIGLVLNLYIIWRKIDIFTIWVFQ